MADNTPTATAHTGLSPAEHRQVAFTRWQRQWSGRLPLIGAATLLLTVLGWVVFRRRSAS